MKKPNTYRILPVATESGVVYVLQKKGWFFWKEIKVRTSSLYREEMMKIYGYSEGGYIVLAYKNLENAKVKMKNYIREVNHYKEINQKRREGLMATREAIKKGEYPTIYY